MAGERLAWFPGRADRPPGKTKKRQSARTLVRTFGCDDALDRVEHLLLDLGRRDARDGSGVGLAAREDRLRNVVTPTPPAFGGMAWPHSVASVIVKLPREKGFGIAVGGRPRLRLLRKPALDAIPRLKVDDRAVQAVVNLPLWRSRPMLVVVLKAWVTEMTRRRVRRTTRRPWRSRPATVSAGRPCKLQSRRSFERERPLTALPGLACP